MNGPIRNYMTKAPLGISGELTLADAKERMSIERIRHLPVMSADTVIGILSARDILILESAGTDPSRTTVELSMNDSPTSFEPTTPLSEVLDVMVTNHIGAALVVEEQDLLGIFTAVDAVRVLRDMLTSS